MALSRQLVAAHIRSVGGPRYSFPSSSPPPVFGQTAAPISLKAHTVHLMTYREPIAKQGLQAMRRPAG